MAKGYGSKAGMPPAMGGKKKKKGMSARDTGKKVPPYKGRRSTD